MFWAIFVAGIAAGFWCLGPFFGVMCGAVMSVPPGLLGAFLYKRARRAGKLHGKLAGRAVVSVVGCAWMLTIYILMKPPSAGALLERYVEIPVSSVDDLRAWSDTWGIDPAFFLRFKATPEVVDQIADKLALRELTIDPGKALTSGLWNVWSGKRSWWTPHQIANPRTWTLPDPGGDKEPWKSMRYDPDNQLVYFQILYH